MATLNDSELAEKVKLNDCNDSLKELIKRHSKICHQVYHKYSPVMSNSGLFVKDVIDDKDFVIYQAAKTYSTSKKCKFSTWLSNKARFQCLNGLKPKSKYKSIIRNEKTDSAGQTYELDKIIPAAEIKNNELKDHIFNILGSFPDKRISEIFLLRYFSDSRKDILSWREVGKRMNLSCQTVLNLHNKGKDFLKNTLTKEEN